MHISHLKGPQTKVKEYFVIFHFSILIDDVNEKNVVDSKERNQQKCGLGQPPEKQIESEVYF